jgi:hypothetical protein
VAATLGGIGSLGAIDCFRRRAAIKVRCSTFIIKREIFGFGKRT